MDHEKKVVHAGLAAMSHRGPDETGLHAEYFKNNSGSVIIGHVRLSIIDLMGGQQPKVDRESGVVLAFNGEIYNYRSIRKDLEKDGYVFRDDSDTEVLLRAYLRWGEECLNRFRGMFAFAIWENRKKKLILARDRFGKKPLFWLIKGRSVLFGSEIKALLCDPDVKPTLDQDAVSDYLLYRYVPGPNTLLKGINKLDPGCLAIWENNELRQVKYYEPPDKYMLKNDVLVKDPVLSFRDRLEEAVRIRMVSDVPYGAFLSGGIDSSAIVALMARYSSSPVKTFSVGFKEERYSELKHAQIIARDFGTEHHEIVVSERDLIQHLPDLVKFRDAPVSEPSDIPIYLVSKEASKHVKMVLTGEGSDEILGGYSKHRYERYVGYYQCLPAWIRNGLLEPLIYALPYRFRRPKTAIANLALGDIAERYPRWFGALSIKDRDRLYKYAKRVQKMRKAVRCEDKNSSLRCILYFDQISWLPDNLLERGDRMTMAASLEARMPFMDHKLAELVSSLPDKYRIRGQITKWILRAAMKDILPRKILGRAKVGFRVPVNEWFCGPMKEYLFDNLTGCNSYTRDFYNEKVLLQVLNDHVEERQNHEKLLWSLLNLEIWSKAYLET